MTISHQTVLDKDGQPAAAIIPWNEFLEIRELIDDDEPTQEELEACQEAEADRVNGNKDAFVPMAEVKERLGI